MPPPTIAPCSMRNVLLVSPTHPLNVLPSKSRLVLEADVTGLSLRTTGRCSHDWVKMAKQMSGRSVFIDIRIASVLALEPEPVEQRNFGEAILILTPGAISLCWVRQRKERRCWCQVTD